VSALQSFDHRPDEADVIGWREPSGIAPALVETLGIGHQKSLLVSQQVEMGKLRHGGSMATPSMKDQHQRNRAALRQRLGNVQQIHAVHAADVDVDLFVIGRRSSGSAVGRRKATTDSDDGDDGKKSDPLPHTDFLKG
jgi:hypothetical protein